MAEAAPEHATYDDVHAPALIRRHASARIHADAYVGMPGEWIGHPTRYPAVIGRDVVVREAARIHAGCERETRIGAGTLVASGAYVGHDVQVGTECVLSPDAVVCGLVTIGDRVKVGANATIKPGITVGDHAIIGAGAVVTKDIPSGETWSGVPAKRMHAWKGGAS